MAHMRTAAKVSRDNVKHFQGHVREGFVKQCLGSANQYNVLEQGTADIIM